MRRKTNRKHVRNALIVRVASGKNVQNYCWFGILVIDCFSHNARRPMQQIRIAAMTIRHFPCILLKCSFEQCARSPELVAQLRRIVYRTYCRSIANGPAKLKIRHELSNCCSRSSNYSDSPKSQQVEQIHTIDASCLRFV